MILEFKLYSLKKDSKTLESLKKFYDKIENPRHKFVNEFIVVGENEDNYKAIQINESGISLFGDLNIQIVSLEISKNDFMWDGQTFSEFDIPKKNLSLDTVDDIKRLNV